MISAYSKAVAQLSDPRIRRVLWISLGLTILLLILLVVGIGFLMTKTVLFDMWWLDGMVDVLGTTAAFILAWILFPAAASSIVGLLLEAVAEAVEARHYPGLEPAPGISVWETVTTTSRLVLLMVVLNLAVLPLYLIPVINIFVFYVLNGYLLGREYFEMVALRRLRPEKMLSLRRSRGLQVFIAGVVAAFLLTIPFINFLAPVIATAAMVHLFEKWRASP